MEILRHCAGGRYARPVIAEMGGKNPAYVTAHADLDVAAEGVARSAFGLSGQKCSALSRVFVHAAVYDAFLDRLVTRARALAVGDPRAAGVFTGPVVNAAAGARFADCGRRCPRRRGHDPLRRRAADRRRLRSRRVRRSRRSSTASTPTTGSAATSCSSRCSPCIAFDDLAAAIDEGNAVDYGLTAGIYTRDAAELATFVESAEAGVLYANRASGATTGAWPGIQSFCGWKGSGTSGKGGLGPHYLAQFMREQSCTIMRP